MAKARWGDMASEYCVECHVRATVPIKSSLRHWAGRESVDHCRPSSARYQALGHPSEGGSRRRGSRRPVEFRGGLRALYPLGGRVPELARSEEHTSELQSRENLV